MSTSTPLPPCPWSPITPSWSEARARAGAAALGEGVCDLSGLADLAARAATDAPTAAWLDGWTRCLERGHSAADAAAWPSPQAHPALAPIALAAFLATVPEAMQRLRDLGLSDDIARASLSDLGRWAKVWQRRHGAWGLGEIGWLSRHWRADIIELGRLQYEFTEWMGPPRHLGAVHLWPCGRVVNVHIPEGGALDPAACEASFARAAEVLPRIWPACAEAPLVCHSWLFDPWLRTVLKPDANLIAFQDLWTHQPGWKSDRSMLRYIFDREQVTAATPDLPTASTLQRAAAAHLKSGGEWVGGVGVRAIPWVWKPEITAVPVERQQRPALVVLAAGLGSRFGGNKQLAQVGPAGETILDFTVHDAIRFGFAEVILVVRPGMEETVRGMVADRISRHIPVRLVPQACDRPRPWGTAHALACALPGLERPCGVVNADDWYNPEGIRLLAEALAASSSEGVLVSYRLGRTLSPNGPVNRAVCGINDAGFLTQVDEACGIVAGAAGPCIVNKDGTVAQQFSDDTPVSLNLWGFHTHTYAAIQMAVQRFLASDPAPTAECFLPSVVMDHICSDGWKITTRCADADWCGLTYPADHESVCARLTQATADGLYPSPLWAAAQKAAIS